MSLRGVLAWRRRGPGGIAPRPHRPLEVSMAPRLDDAARHLADALKALGVESPRLDGTPARVAELWADLLGANDAEGDEPTPFPNPDPASDAIVLAARLPFHAMCAHHLLPFFGRAHVAF